MGGSQHATGYFRFRQTADPQGDILEILIA